MEITPDYRHPLEPDFMQFYTDLLGPYTQGLNILIDDSVAPLARSLNLTPLSWLVMWMGAQSSVDTFHMQVTVRRVTVTKIIQVQGERATVTVSVPEYDYESIKQCDVLLDNWMRTLNSINRILTAPMNGRILSVAYSVRTVSFNPATWIEALTGNTTHTVQVPISRYLIALPLMELRRVTTLPTEMLSGTAYPTTDAMTDFIADSEYLRTDEYVAAILHGTAMAHLQYMLYPVGIWDAYIEPSLQILEMIRDGLIPDAERNRFLDLYGADTVDELADEIDGMIRNPAFIAYWWLGDEVRSFSYLSLQV
jgi:hypothetical protein